MALTPEQIKNLKPYDTLILNNYPISYLCTYISGIIGALDNKAEACCNTSCYFPQQYLSLPPKHDPCRKLKCGDVVELVEWNGRFPIPKSYFEEISINTFRVVAEECRGIVTIDILGTPHPLPICFINLITPVEELEPYSIDPANTNVLFKRGKKFATFEDDDEAQELCDRLNEEWRNEQNNEM